MSDLQQAAEMALTALNSYKEKSWSVSINGDLVEQAQDALRQALDQLPDTTKMIDTGIDRGAWSDVEDATKWVDELRGDEPDDDVNTAE